MSNIIEDSFKNYITTYRFLYNNYNDVIKLGILYSCSVDSSVLLYVANKYKNFYKLDITILYVDFNDFKNSEHTNNLAIQMVNTYNNTLKYESCELLSKSLVFNNEYDLILTGYHTDDQNDTILSRLFQRTNLNDPSNINYTKNNKKLLFGKPFLEINKTDIIDYACLYNIQFIEDESFSNSFTANPLETVFNFIFTSDTSNEDTKQIYKVINNIKEHVEEQYKKNSNIDIYSGKWNINDFINLSIGNRIFIIREYFRVVHGYNFNQGVIKELRKKLEDDMTDLFIYLNNRFLVIRKDKYIICQDIKMLQ